MPLYKFTELNVINQQHIKRMLLVSAYLLLSGCNSLYFYPMKDEVLTPAKFGMQYKDLYVRTVDNVDIHGWHIPAVGFSKGSVIFFHGNAQNITTHIASVYWLPKQGFDVYIFDYRGYGRSQGFPSVEGVMTDAATVLKYVITDLGKKNVVVFGQSLGGVIALNAVSRFDKKQSIKALVVDSSFSGFREIAREKLSDIWLTWIFQYPLSYAFTASYDPKLAAAKIAPVPLLVIHGNADNIIPMHHGKKLFEAAYSPKLFWKIESGKHISSMGNQGIREKFLRFLDAAVNDDIYVGMEQNITLNTDEID